MITTDILPEYAHIMVDHSLNTPLVGFAVVMAIITIIAIKVTK